jgi:N-acetylglucosamine-6-phosphate deacetylase
MNSKAPVSIPGFVDLQVNGFAGSDFSSLLLTHEELAAVCTALAGQGTAAMLATLITSPIELYRRNLPLIGEAVQSAELHGRLLGIHLEGPFISSQAGFVGAHDARYVRAPDTSLLRELWELSQGTIRLLTLAAELPGAEELACYAQELSIAVSIGHSNCDQEDLQRLVRVGATGLTHLGNGIPNQLPRHRNPVWAGLAENDLTATIIADGFHLPDSLIKVILDIKGPGKTIVVSDVSPIGGLPAGEYDYGGSRVVLEPSGRIYNPQRDCLAGSGITLLPSMNRLASLGLLSQSDLLALAFDNPLRFINASPTEICSGMRLVFDGESTGFSIGT